MKKIIAGNWKMNGSVEMLTRMIEALKGADTSNVTVIICPPCPYLGAASVAGVAFGAQDCSEFDAGAYTGEVSAGMIAETGAKYVIVGHSERRGYHGETNEIISRKAAAAVKNGLIPIICVGETMEEKNTGQTNEIIETQLREIFMSNDSLLASHDVIVAYEPRWAIGAGITPTHEEIAGAHGFIAKVMESLGINDAKILYGASVKGGNAAEIMGIPNVGGVLVGGASLKPEDFLPIINAVK
ncbi:MAG: triose-phosphate isomerase [Rickettsiales bacterium]|nr:triose-phosphate isomerase [Rickettsiales bacterium]